MNSYSSSTPLLCPEDDIDGETPAWTLTTQDEDCSSGYGSQDVSDVESDVMSTARSCDSLLTSGHEGVREVMKFKSTHALCENMKMILEMPEMCDVTFLVGPREVPVYGVRAILGTRSSVISTDLAEARMSAPQRVFYQLILRHLHMRNDVIGESTKKSKKSKKSANQNRQSSLFTPKRLTIPVRKYDTEVFRMLIQFVHCGCAAITEDTVAGLLCGAVQFELSDLADACWDFIDRCVISSRCENLLFSARCYTYHKVSEEIIDKIYSYRAVDGKSDNVRRSRESVV